MCVLSAKDFSQKGNLDRHLKSHTGEQPYKCSICGRGCIHKQDLKANSHNCELLQTWLKKQW